MVKKEGERSEEYEKQKGIMMIKRSDERHAGGKIIINAQNKFKK